MGKDTLSLFYPASILLKFTLILGRVIVLKTVNIEGICQNHHIAYICIFIFLNPCGFKLSSLTRVSLFKYVK
jgi:hypothetical protein